MPAVGGRGVASISAIATQKRLTSPSVAPGDPSHDKKTPFFRVGSSALSARTIAEGISQMIESETTTAIESLSPEHTIVSTFTHRHQSHFDARSSRTSAHSNFEQALVCLISIGDVCVVLCVGR